MKPLWASLAITAIWVAVLFTSVFAPSFETSGAGGDHTTIPSGVLVAICAVIATAVIAHAGLRDRGD